MERLEPTAITHEKKGTWSEPNLYEDMFQPLIFPGVFPLKNSPKNQVHLRQLEASQRLYHSVGHLAGGAFIHQVKRWEFRFFFGGRCKKCKMLFFRGAKSPDVMEVFFSLQGTITYPTKREKGFNHRLKTCLDSLGGICDRSAGGYIPKIM